MTSPQHHPAPEPTPLPTGGRHDHIPARRLIPLSQAAHILGMSLGSARRLVWGGKLHAVKLTRRVLVDLRDLDRLIEEAKDRRSW